MPFKVVYLKDESDQNAQGSSSMKRKADDEAPGSSKRRKLDQQGGSKQPTEEGDIIILESAETDRNTSNNSLHNKGTKNALAKRCLQDEINLSNDMVR